MREGTQQLAKAPAIAGLAGNIISFALGQYWLAGKAQFLPTTSGLFLAGAIITGLAGIACWAISLKILAEGRGQSTWFAALAPLGPFGMGILYLTEDLKEKKRPHLRRAHASR